MTVWCRSLNAWREEDLARKAEEEFGETPGGQNKLMVVKKQPMYNKVWNKKILKEITLGRYTLLRLIRI